MEEKLQCWEILQCDKKECPAHVSENLHCWLMADTMGCNRTHGTLLGKIELCLECEVFKLNMDTTALHVSCKTVAEQFSRAQAKLKKRDDELAAVSLEMALGLSEVFEALKKIAAGDPLVRIKEDSSLELISKLKQLVNKTAADMAEIIDLSHEFAIGLAEHFDVLHRVTTGDLAARISGESEIELVRLLKQVTNQTIRSVQQEITTRKRIATNLRKSEERFRTFAEKAPTGITIMGPDLRYEYINPTFVEIFGYTPKDIPDKNAWFKKAYPDEAYRNEVISRWEKYSSPACKPGEIQHLTLTVRCKDGRDKVISFRTVILKEGKHFVTYADITEREQAQAAIRASEEKYRTLIDNIQDGVFIVQDYKYAFVNEALAKMVGFSAAEMIGMDFLNTIAPEDLEMVIDRHVNRESGNQVDREYEFCMLHKDRLTRVPANIHVDSLIYQNKVTMIGTIKDITERKRAEKNKRKLETRLQRASKMEAIGTLAGGVAHDLNNILSGIVSYPELILMDLAEGHPLRKPIMTIQKSGERATAIVQDLLTLARRGVASTEIVDLNHILEGYLRSPEYDLLYNFYPEIRLESRLDNDLMNILGSPVHLSKTVMNLVSNAAEAMPAGGTITISTENQYVDHSLKGYEDVKEGDYVVLQVSDSGVGISPKDMDQIFEPFYTKKVMGRSGTGLGMAVVWGTVKDHNGYIDIQSIEGHGATFTLYFPVTRKQIPDAKKNIGIENLMGNGEAILVVDDVPEQREIATAMLAKMGYKATAVSGGLEALTYLKANAVELVVLDMIMDPGIDGLETFRRIRKLKPGQKAIIASGFSETDRVKEAQQIGAGEYVKKPYSVEKLCRAVQRALE